MRWNLQNYTRGRSPRHTAAYAPKKVEEIITGLYTCAHCGKEGNGGLITVGEKSYHPPCYLSSLEVKG